MTDSRSQRPDFEKLVNILSARKDAFLIDGMGILPPYMHWAQYLECLYDSGEWKNWGREDITNEFNALKELNIEEMARLEAELAATKAELKKSIETNDKWKELYQEAVVTSDKVILYSQNKVLQSELAASRSQNRKLVDFLYRTIRQEDANKLWNLAQDLVTEIEQGEGNNQ